MKDLALRRMLLVLSLVMALALGGQRDPGGGDMPLGRLHVVAEAAAAVGGGLPAGIAATLLYACVRSFTEADATRSRTGETATRLLVGVAVSVIVAGLAHAVDVRDSRIARLEQALLERQETSERGAARHG